MGLLDFLFKKDTPQAESMPTPVEVIAESPAIQMQDTKKAMSIMDAAWGYGGNDEPIINVIYSGEKNFGELGPVLKYQIDHDKMGKRAWQLYLGSETIWTVIRQKTRWKIGTGLRLDAEPQVDVLKAMGIDFDEKKIEDFNAVVESLWKVYAYSPRLADYSNRASLHKIAKRGDKNMNLRGDVLVVLRIGDDGYVKVQLIDGTHVSTPVSFPIIATTDEMVDNYIGYDYINPETKNRVRFGVEINDKGEHIAYHVRVGIGLKWERIKAYNRHGSLIAYFWTGEEYTLDDPRGIPAITPNMESSKQLDDYGTATLSGVVERARIAYTIEHDIKGEGTDPRLDDMAKIVGGNKPLDIATTAEGKVLANTIAASTNRNTYNLPKGATLQALDSKQEIHFKDFHETKENVIYASQDLPPEVARQLFGNSYSASRAAMNGMGFSLEIDREDMGMQFYQPIYNLQLDIWVLTFKVQAPGYIEALRKGDQTVLAAYRFANWVGAPIPEIDELNAVKAERLKLGPDKDHMPLTTGERSTQKLGTGNYKANMKQVAREIDETTSEGIEPIPPYPPQQESEDDAPGQSEGDKAEKKRKKKDEDK